MKKKDFTFSEKIKLCNDLGIFLSELNNNNNTNHFGGRISNLKVYDRELTALEVKQNYNAIKGRFGL